MRAIAKPLVTSEAAPFNLKNALFTMAEPGEEEPKGQKRSRWHGTRATSGTIRRTRSGTQKSSGKHCWVVSGLSCHMSLWRVTLRDDQGLWPTQLTVATPHRICHGTNSWLCITWHLLAHYSSILTFRASFEESLKCSPHCMPHCLYTVFIAYALSNCLICCYITQAYTESLRNRILK